MSTEHRHSAEAARNAAREALAELAAAQQPGLRQGPSFMQSPDYWVGRLAQHLQILLDIEDQAAVWAVFEPTEGEVAGPFTHRDAATWAEVNALSFAGPLTVGRARTDLDEQHAEGKCRSKWSGYACNRGSGHRGYHEAYDPTTSDVPLAAWDDAGRTWTDAP